ncbi:MAG: DNA mismatch repair endonuclease MutL [Clostridiales bacterium]|nr:DNA mismatch repair endonuclease MutL [Clostridiales bacterium]
MPKINILDKSVYSLIAAGEVIEKPASVVKELLENSIDAGSHNIELEIKGGGIDYVRVTDDGCGIAKEDMSVAFMPHTTSKILNAEDLYNISTLGFRGEALSTITAVSKVTMISKTADSDSGNILKINAGEIIKLEPIGASDGTTIIVEDLFYNIPARKKFLRKAKQEENDITNIVSRIILSHPDVCIKYVADDKIIYSSSGTGLFDSIYSIYGKSIVGNIYPINFETDIFKVAGYIGGINYTKPNRTYQTLIVNGRYVINQQIATAIYKAYESYMMKNNFPFFVLNMTIDNNLVDVNVHPNKLDIKFSCGNKIFETFLVEISKAILDNINIDNVVLTNDESKDIQPEINLENLQKLDENLGVSYKPKEDNKQETGPILRPQEVTISDNPTNVLMDYNYKTRGEGNIFAKPENDIVLHSPSALEVAMQETKEKFNNATQSAMFDTDIVNNDKIINVNDNNTRVVGILFDTYIIIEEGDHIYFIDQHAGHERVLFDKYIQEYNNSSVYTQPMLIPYILDVNPTEASYIDENIETFSKLGFVIDLFGKNKYRVSEIPGSLPTISIKSFFDEVLSNINNARLTLTSSDIVRDYIAKTACKHAIKANDKLDISQIEYLIKLLDTTPVLLCPHGRPIVLKITKKEIEKWFKRIV